MALTQQDLTAIRDIIVNTPNNIMFTTNGDLPKNVKDTVRLITEEVIEVHAAKCNVQELVEAKIMIKWYKLLIALLGSGVLGGFIGGKGLNTILSKILQ